MRKYIPVTNSEEEEAQKEEFIGMALTTTRHPVN